MISGAAMAPTVNIPRSTAARHDSSALSCAVGGNLPTELSIPGEYYPGRGVGARLRRGQMLERGR